MKTSIRIHLNMWVAALITLILPTGLLAQSTGWLQTAAGTYDYNNSGNWVDGEINGVWDSSLTITGHQTATFDDDAIAPSLTFGYTGNFDVTLRSDGTATRMLTLDGDISVTPASNRTITFGSTTANNGLDINLGGASRLLTVNAGKSLTILNVVSNGGLEITGGGTVTLSGANTFADGVTVKLGQLRLGHATALGTGTLTLGDTEGSTAVSLNATVVNLVNTENNPQIWNQNFTFHSGQSLDLGTGAVTLAGSRIITANSRTLTVGGVISGSSYSLTQAGSGALLLTGANTYGGGTIIESGNLQFGPGAIPANGLIFVHTPGSLNTGTTFGTLQEWLGSGKIDPASTGTLALTGNSGNTIDFHSTGYPGLLLGASTAATYTGTLTPFNGIYRLGGGGATLTFSAANTLTGPRQLVVGATGSSAGTTTFTAPQDFTGETTVDNRTLSLSGAEGAFTASPITVNRGGILNLSSPAGVIGTTRATRLTLRSGLITIDGNSTVDSVETLSGPVTIDGAELGGVNFMRINPNSNRNAQLIADSIIRTNAQIFVLTGRNLGAAPAANVANFKLNTTPSPIVGGGGEPETTNISIVPWTIGSVTPTDPGSSAALSFLTYDPTHGFRPLDVATEYDIYDNGFTGAVSGTDRNVRIPASATVTFTGTNTINSLYMGTVSAGATLNGDGVLAVTSGAIFMAANTTTTIAVPLDFGSAQGVIGFWQGKGTAIPASIAGTGGIVLYQANQQPAFWSGGSGVSLTGDCTYTGDTHIHGRVNVGPSVFPSGERTGDIYLHGICEANNATINGLNGTGVYNKPNSGGGLLTVGDNDANGDFSGSFTQNGALSITKIGAGTQRFSGTSSVTGTLTIEGGTLVADGSFVSAITVAANGTLSGAGTIDRSGAAITVQAGATLAPGRTDGFGTLTVLQGDVALNDGAELAFRLDRNGSGALSVEGAVTGDVDISVSVSGESTGKWMLIEAASIEPTFSSTTPGVILTPEAGNTQLWAERLNPATTLILR